MTSQTVPILPGLIYCYRGPVDQETFKHLLRSRWKKVFSLDRTQLRILVDIVIPYWQNYLKAIVHPFDVAYIGSLQFGWVGDIHSKDARIARVARVIVESYTDLDLMPEKILFQIELCRHNVPHHCLIIHEGRGQFEIPFRDQECHGIVH